MASLTTKPNGTHVIGFADADGRPRWLYPGVMPRRAAETIRGHVEELVSARTAGREPPAPTAAWLAAVGETLHARLARAGLTAPRTGPAARRLGDLLAAYVARRTDLQPRSVVSLKRAVTSLNAHFGVGRDYATITRAEAADFKRAGLAKFAPATVANDIKKARQIFADALDRGLTARNPFSGIKAGSQANPDRLVYVPAADVRRVIDSAPGPEWAAVFALTRFGGLRCPSETAALRWPDVDWDAQRITVTSPKGRRHGKGRRVIPLFGELYLPLLRLYEAAADRGGYVLPTLRGENLATQGDRLIGRAGLTPWPRTFQNLRASCETDLARQYPIHTVCAWIGNTPAVAVAHYLSVTEEEFSRAAGAQKGAASVAPVTGVFGERVPATAPGTTERGTKTQVQLAPAVIQRVSVSGRNLTADFAALNPALGHPAVPTGANACHAVFEALIIRGAGRAA